MTGEPRIKPPSLYQRYMPRHVQDVLAAYRIKLPAFDIMVNDDGTPTSTAEAVAAYVASQMMARVPTPFTADMLEVVGEVAAHFGRMEGRKHV